jgi:serine/threonine protein phosphatase PrpC
LPRLDAWAATDVGRRRSVNEDSFLVDPALGLWVVADGIGGSAAGDVASARCVEFVRAELLARRPALVPLANQDGPEVRAALQRLVAEVVRGACQSLHALAQSEVRWRGMGSTCVVAVQCGARVAVAHVGDSRAWLLRHGGAHRLTADHSLVAEQVRRGLIGSGEAASSPFRHVVTRAMGLQPSVEVDVLVVDVAPGDLLLLTTDGIHDALSEEAELADLCGAGSAATLPGRLVKLADERGGRDNATVVVLRVEADDVPAPDADVTAIVELLRGVALFSFMTYKELLALVSLSRERRAGAGELLVREGEPGDELFILVSGAVEVSKGGRAMTRLSAGGHFGEMSLVDLASRSASVTAVSTSRLLVLRREPLMQLLRSDATLAVKLLWAFVQVFSERLRHTTDVLSGLRDVMARLSPPNPEATPAFHHFSPE